MLLRLTDEMTAALPIIDTLQRSGHEAVFVGGAVRDVVLGLPIHDVDIATSALPEQTLALFPKCIPTGLQHGTITVVHEGIPYEVTTYRIESQYEAHRKPKGVVFIEQLDEDLLRRDFTMNAMAIKNNGELYDPFHGERDLRAAKLRCVGDPNLRFQEDALRMVRAVRFLGSYELAPVLSAWRSLKRHGGLLRHVAMERVQAELDKMIGSKWPARSLLWLAASGLLSYWKDPLPERVISKANDALRAAREGCHFALSEIGQLQGKDERWAALLLSIQCSSAEASDIFALLRFSNKRSTFILSVMNCQEQMESAGISGERDKDRLKQTWIKAVIRLGEDSARHWLAVARLLPDKRGKLSSQTAASLERILDELPVKTLKRLAVGGTELLRHLDRPAGPWLSAMLNRLLLAAALGETVNEKEKLLALAKLWNEEERNDER